MGYVACIEAQVVLCTAFHFLKRALTELRATGSYTGVSEPQFVAAGQESEDLIDLSKHYEIEAETVEKRPQRPVTPSSPRRCEPPKNAGAPPFPGPTAICPAVCPQ